MIQFPSISAVILVGIVSLSLWSGSNGAFVAKGPGSLHGRVLAATTTATSSSFSLQTTSTRLYFGIPSFLIPKDESSDDQAKSTSLGKNAKKDESHKSQDNKIGLSGVLQLITAGMGAPFLGDFEGVDKETGKFMFSLEANNLVDEQGRSKQTQMPYFESGWVDPEDEKRAAEGFKFPWQK